MADSDSLLKGDFGESITAAYINRKGFNIIARNYHSRYGEIDIIAADSEFILFIEVKTRNDYSPERPAAAVTLSKQRKIIKTALIFLTQYEYDLQPRFDVSEVILERQTNAFVDMNYIESAFIPEGDISEAF